MKCFLTIVLAITINTNSVQSLLTFYRPRVSRKSLLTKKVGLLHEPPQQYDQNSSVGTRKVNSTLSDFESAWRKYAMIAYVAHMCVAIPVGLIPTLVKSKLQLAPKADLEHEALLVGQACARALFTMIPFMNLKVIPYQNENPTPTVWVSNHVSMLDTFVFLCADSQLRGKNRRPIKVIYWKGLDANPVCKVLFTMAGFIPVDMENNGNGNPNKYDPISFKAMLKSVKAAINEGFDILVLPEGQLNPTPEAGLQPVFPGAYALAKSSGRPIQMVALHGCQSLWHANENIGMTITGKDVTIKAYPPLKNCDRYEDFLQAFSKIVGVFGSTGKDAEDEVLRKWLDL